LGFLVRRASRAVRLALTPDNSIWRSCDSRKEIKAISAATKRPAKIIKRRTRLRSRANSPELPTAGLWVRLAPELAPWWRLVLCKILGSITSKRIPFGLSFEHLPAPVGECFTFIQRIVGHVPARRRSE